MVDYIKNDTGITLVSLVITVIVMLILAGVSLSMVVGENSVIKQAQRASFMQEVTKLKEELETEFLGQDAKFYAENLKHLDRTTITYGGANMKKLIPSIKPEFYDKYMILRGELYYIGDDDFLLSVCADQNYKTKPADMSVEEFVKYVEGAAMEEIVKKMAGINNVTGIGEPLAKKMATAGFGSSDSSWKIITEVVNGENVATYADGWYYVPAETDVPDIGKVRYSYIINYDTRKAVRFTDNHVILSSSGNLAVDDNLVFNADPTNMDGSPTSWGGAQLFGFPAEASNEPNPVSGWTKSSLNFDGVDDYLQYKLPEDEDYFKTEGITIEFYGYLNNSLGYSTISFYKGYEDGASESFKHTLSNVKSSEAKCEIPNDILHISGVYTTSTDSGGTAQCPNWGCDFHIKLDNKPHNGDIFVTYVLNKNGEYKVYIDGELEYEDKWNDAYAAQYNAHLINNSYPIQLGVKYRGADRLFAKQKIYSLRIYDQLLTPTEVEANYKATTSYHNILVKGEDVGNNNTGGEDFEDVFEK